MTCGPQVKKLSPPRIHQDGVKSMKKLVCLSPVASWAPARPTGGANLRRAASEGRKWSSLSSPSPARTLWSSPAGGWWVALSHFSVLAWIQLRVEVQLGASSSTRGSVFTLLPERDSVREEEEAAPPAPAAAGEAPASQQPSGRTAHGRLGEGDETGRVMG